MKINTKANSLARAAITDSVNHVLLEAMQIIPTRLPPLPIGHNYSSQELPHLKKD